MTLVQDPPQHPLLRFTDALDHALDRAHATEPAFMTPADRRAALVALRKARARLDALELRILAAAAGDDLLEVGAYRETADYLATQTGTDYRAVKKAERLGLALDERWHLTGTALQHGQVNTAQAHVIADGLDALKDDVTPEILTACETELIGLAGKYPPRELRRCAKRILQYVAPDLADEHEARTLEAEERRAREAMSLHILRNAGGIPGLSEARWKSTDADIDRLLTYLDAYTSPRHLASEAAKAEAAENGTVPGSPASGERLPLFRQRALAMRSLLEHLDPAKLPQHGGTATTLIVTIDHETLLGKLGTASLLNGDQISAGEARRLACTAALLPAVLNGQSEILDLGRSERFYTPAQVRALRLRDKHCRAENCHQPAEHCEAHHKQPWSQGGNTDLADGILLCCFHHHRIHDQHFQHEYLPNGDVRYTRRT